MRQVLDFRSQNIVVVGGNHRVGAAARGFGDGVSGFAHIVDIVADATGHAVVATVTIQRVVSVKAEQGVGPQIASDHIVQRVAGAAEAGAASERQIFDVAGECPGHCRVNQIGSRTCRFRSGLATTAGIVNVVAGAANHGVDTAHAVQRIVAIAAGQGIDRAIADEHVVTGIAGGGSRRASQCDVFDIGKRSDRIADGRGNSVIATASARSFGNDVACIVD